MSSVVLVWTTARGEERDFPEALITALGLLLTALVFMLGLAQARLQRTADAVVREVGELEKTVVNAYIEHPDAVTTLDLWARAGAMKEALWSGGPRTRRERRAMLSRARSPIGNWGPAGRLNVSFELLHIDEQLKLQDGDPGASPKKRRSLLRRRETLIGEAEEIRAADENAGVTAHGFARLRARAEIAELSAHSYVRYAAFFTFLMLVVVVLGVVYSGWNLDQPITPQMWAALVLVMLAGAHSSVVNQEINAEISAVTLALRDLSLITLYDAENALGWYWERLSEREDTEGTNALHHYLRRHFDHVEQRTPGLYWLASLRGRFELAEAIDAERRHIGADFSEGHDARQFAELCEHLPVAVRLLKFATTRKDDPGAELGYAHALRLAADLTEEGAFPQVPYYFDADTPEALRTEAQEHVHRALQLMRDLPILPSGLFGLPHRGWFTHQTFLWPEWDQEALLQLQELLLIEPQSDLGPV